MEFLAYYNVLQLMEGFVEEFLYENPLSQLGFILSRNKRAEKVCWFITLYL